MKFIDINADVGEIKELIENESQVKLMSLVSSVNICCGAHGDTNESQIISTLTQAKHLGLSVGAHPSYPDRENFGRKSLNIPEEALIISLREQLDRIKKLSESVAVTIKWIKPHGALYHDVGEKWDIANCLHMATQDIFKTPPALMLMNGANQIPFLEALGYKILKEGFLDRGYESEFKLIPRSQSGALLDAQHASEQALRLAEKVDTLCIHGDTPNCIEIVQRVRAHAESNGFKIKAKL